MLCFIQSVTRGSTSTAFTALKFTSCVVQRNLWLIVKSFVSFDPVYPCCLFVCDLPTELSWSNLCLTLASSGWDTLQNINLCYLWYWLIFRILSLLIYLYYRISNVYKHVRNLYWRHKPIISRRLRFCH